MRNNYTKQSWDQCRNVLSAMHQELRDSVRAYIRSLIDARTHTDRHDEAEHPNAEYATRLITSVVAKQTRAIGEVERAIAKIDADAYGRCENCGYEISENLLLDEPWARLCNVCAADQELLTNTDRTGRLGRRAPFISNN